jgi:hypothetical protein
MRPSSSHRTRTVTLSRQNGSVRKLHGHLAMSQRAGIMATCGLGTGWVKVRRGHAPLTRPERSYNLVSLLA